MMLSNEELVLRLKAQPDTQLDDDFELLHSRFTPLYCKMSTTIKIVDFDIEDYKQEGRIALHKAIQSFDPSQGKYFASYFSQIYKNRLINHHRRDNAKCRIPAHMIISLNHIKKSFKEDSTFKMENFLTDHSIQIFDHLIAKEQFIHYIETLSHLERKVLIHRMNQEDNSCKNIAKILNLHPRTVENALSRCWKKSKKYL